jgi:putative hydrolase of the HAD superfamily
VNGTSVVFDLGGVLVQWRPELILSRAFDDPAARAAVRASLFEHADWVALDRGTLTEEEAIARTAARTGQPEPALQRLMEIVRETLTPLPETVALLEDLHRQGVPLYCLSNMHTRCIAHLRQRYPFCRCFRGMVISAEVHLVKPEPAIYRHLLAAFALEPTRTVFIDDHPANCRAAEVAGLQTIQFTTADECRALLDHLLAHPPDRT